MAISRRDVLLGSAGALGAATFSFPKPALAESEPIKIGFLAAMTGPSSAPTIGFNRGVVFAVDTFNAAGGVKGRKIEVITRDTQGDPTKAVNATQELISQANVDATQPDMTRDMLRARNAGAEVIVVWSVTTGMEARMFNTRAAMNWDVSFVGHPSLSSGEIAGLVEKPANWEKVYAVGYKSVSYDAAGKLPPKTQDLVDRLTT